MKLCILTPVKDSIPEPAVTSVVDLAIALTRRGVDVVRRTVWLSSNLPKARTMLVRQALESGADLALFVDDDIHFTVADLDVLLDARQGDDIVSGAYRKRCLGGEHIGSPSASGSDRGPLLAMDRIGLGFALAPRRCLERMIEAHGDGCFEFRFDGTRMLGEDETFCDRWRAMGGRIWLHAQVNLGHVGPHIFR